MFKWLNYWCQVDVFDFSFSPESQRKEYLLSEVPEHFREALAKFNPGLLYFKFVLTLRVRFTEPFRSIYALVSKMAPFEALELDQTAENTSVEDLVRRHFYLLDSGSSVWTFAEFSWPVWNAWPLRGLFRDHSSGLFYAEGTYTPFCECLCKYSADYWSSRL